MEDYNILMKQRFEKADELIKNGVDLFKYKYDKELYIKEIKEKFSDVGEEEKGYVKTAGRMMIKRVHGKTAFADLKDETDKIQLYVRKDFVGDDTYALFKKLDIGDIIGVEGSLFRTRTGELTIIVKKLEILTKSFRPLPEKFHGLQDKELIYRQRYVDLIVNDESRERFKKRSLILKSIRNFMDSYGYMEVETPILLQVYGGAEARPFITHHNALNRDLYLRIALETYLKRLVVGGFEKVYEIGRVFRNEGISKKHNPEFTLMEFYEAYKDLYDMMDFTEKLISHLVEKLGYEDKIVKYGDKEIDFSTPWKRISMKDAIKEIGGLDIDGKSEEELREIIKKEDEDIDLKTAGYGKLIQILFELFVEEKLINPTFVTDHPLEVSPLAKRKRDDESGLFVERFELFVNGWELANAFSELNDPIDQEERFKEQERKFAEGDDEAQRMDTDFIRALQYGMPPTGGVGIGIDRLVMLLTNAETIKDVILFPHLKDEN